MSVLDNLMVSVLDNLVVYLHEFERQKASNKSYVKELVDCARRDLRASVSLRSQGDYPNAIYHLQQASEKLVKAYGICTLRLSESEVRSVRHVSPEVFLKMLRRKWIRPLLNISKVTTPSLDVSPLQNLNSITSSLQRTSTKVAIARYSKGQIEPLLSMGNMFVTATNTEEAKRKVNEALDFFEANPERVVKEVRQRFHDSLTVEVVLRVVKRYREGDMKFLKGSVDASMLYTIAVVTYPHEAFTRYPDGEIKPSDYREGLGIVDAADAITTSLKRCMVHMEQDYL